MLISLAYRCLIQPDVFPRSRKFVTATENYGLILIRR